VCNKYKLIDKTNEGTEICKLIKTLKKIHLNYKQKEKGGIWMPPISVYMKWNKSQSFFKYFNFFC